MILEKGSNSFEIVPNKYRKISLGQICCILQLYIMQIYIENIYFGLMTKQFIKQTDAVLQKYN